LHNLGKQLVDAGEADPLNGQFPESAEPTLILIQLGSIGVFVIEIAAGLLRQPCLALDVLVGAKVLHDQVDININRD
jgi:hypothetical protein